MKEFKGIAIAALAVVALASPAAATWNGAHMHDSLGMWEAYQGQASGSRWTEPATPAPTAAPAASAKDPYDNISGPRGVGWSY